MPAAWCTMRRSFLAAHAVPNGSSDQKTRRPANTVDKKIKKKIEVLRQRIQKKRQQLSGAKRQNDEPGEVEQLESDIASLESEIRSLQGT